MWKETDNPDGKCLMNAPGLRRKIIRIMAHAEASHLPLALRWLALRCATTCWDARRTPARANQSNADTEGALEKNRGFFYTDFWEVFYLDRMEEKSGLEENVWLKLTVISLIWLWFTMASCQQQFEDRIFALEQCEKQELHFDSF